MLPLSARRFGFMGRRRALASGGGGIDLSDTSAYVLRGFTAAVGNQAAYVSSADANTITTISQPNTVLLAIRLRAASTVQTVLSAYTAGGGWEIYIDTSARPNVRVRDAGLTVRTRVGSAMSVGNDIHLIAFTNAAAGGGTGVVRLYQDGVTPVNSPSHTGQAPPVAGRKLQVGGTTGPCDGCDVLGFAVVDTVLSDGEVSTWFDAVQSQQFVTTAPTGASITYNVKRTMSDLCARDTWNPNEGSGLALLARSTTLSPATTALCAVEQIASPTWTRTFTSGDPYVKSGDATAADGRVAIDARGGGGSTPFIDNQHWAFSGDKSSDFLAAGSNDLATLAASHPNLDVILIMLGTNGMADDTARAQEETDLAALYAYAYTFWPTALVIVTTIIPNTDSAKNARIVTFNANLPAIWDATSYHADGLLVRADAYSAINPATMFSDGTHPNDLGHEALAVEFILALIEAIYLGTPLRGLVRWCAIGDSITVGVGSTDGVGYRRVMHDTYAPPPWEAAA